MLRALALAAALLIACAGPALALGYTIDFDGTLYAIDCPAGRATKLGAVGETLTDLGTTPGGALYGVSADALWRIDLEDPSRSRRVGAHGLRGPYGFCISPGGVAYANTADGMFCRIDLSTGAATPIGPMGGGFRASGDLIFVGETLLGSVKDAAGVETLVTIDPRTGAATKVGAIVDAGGASVPDVFGLIHEDGVLFGLTAGGRIVVIDPKTARAGLADLMSIRFWGASDAVVDL